MATSHNHFRPYYEDLYEDIFFLSHRPYNLVHSGSAIVLDAIPEDAPATVAYVIDNHPGFKDKEREVMRLRYVEELSLKDIGTIMGVTPERIRQTCSCGARKLGANGLYKLVLRYGISLLHEAEAAYAEIRERRKAELLEEIEKADFEMAQLQINAEKAGLTVEDIKAMPLSYCDFSVRTYNCLHRVNVDTVDALTRITFEDLIHIRNMGRRSAMEVLLWLDDNHLNATCLYCSAAQELLAEAKARRREKEEAEA